MTVLVTGAVGFVGRALVAELVRTGVDVVAFDRDGSGADQRAGVRSVAGDITDPTALDAVLTGQIDAIAHLASVPGGTAEADPALARQVNLDATIDLLERCTRDDRRRFVFASSIAVYGETMPRAGVDDTTPPNPQLLYGAHKAMVEIAVATATNRGEIDAISLRLPGIVARPRSPSGLRSAFISDLFHALRRREPISCPVSPDATVWVQSARQCARNLARALGPELPQPDGRAILLPAHRPTVAALVEEIARQTGAPTALVTWRPDAALERAFGNQPPLHAAAAQELGFRDDGSLADLVRNALDGIGVA